jgi:hypothetical protein
MEVAIFREMNRLLWDGGGTEATRSERDKD